MISLREAVQDYLQMRRNLGFKLHDAGKGLLNFIGFMNGAELRTSLRHWR